MHKKGKSTFCFLGFRVARVYKSLLLTSKNTEHKYTALKEDPTQDPAVQRFENGQQIDIVSESSRVLD